MGCCLQECAPFPAFVLSESLFFFLCQRVHFQVHNWDKEYPQVWVPQKCVKTYRQPLPHMLWTCFFSNSVLIWDFFLISWFLCYTLLIVCSRSLVTLPRFFYFLFLEHRFAPFSVFNQIQILVYMFGIANPLKTSFKWAQTFPLLTCSAPLRAHVTFCQTSEKSLSHLPGAFPPSFFFCLFVFSRCSQVKLDKPIKSEVNHMSVLD